MKKNILLTFMLFAFSALAQVNSDVLNEKKLYFSALHQFLLDSSKLEMISTEKEKVLEDLLSFTGIEVLENYKIKLISRFQNPSVLFFLAKIEFENKNYKRSIELTDQIFHTSVYKAEAIFYKILSQTRLGTDVTVLGDEINQCKKFAQEKGNKTETPILRQYHQQIYELCTVTYARSFFNKQEWTKSLDAYNQLSKKAYRWPSTLLEKAWINFHLENYNRSLGLLVTYKNPLLENFFIPESEYLTALNYFKLCLWDDSISVIDKFYAGYKEKTDVLQANLTAQKNSDKYFYNLMVMSPEERKTIHPFIHKLALQVQKQMRFIRDYDTMSKLEKEISSLEKSDLTDKDIRTKHVKSLQESLVSKINSYTKEEFFKMINSIYFVSEELFKLKLEILASQKDLMYKQKELVAKRSRGSFSQVKRTKLEHFWKFNGSFWADELGDYSFGLKSNCDLKRKSVE